MCIEHYFGQSVEHRRSWVDQRLLLLTQLYVLQNISTKLIERKASIYGESICGFQQRASALSSVNDIRL